MSKSDDFQAEQADLFSCNLANWPIKDDMASMEVPLFSLTKQKDTNTREYQRGNKTVRVIPSGVGSATVFDKDLLLYISSQIVAALNQKQPISKTVYINTIDFLMGTGRGKGRASMERIPDMLRRLKGTIVETNIPTGNKVQTEGFSIIDSYTILSEKVRTEEVINPKTHKKEIREISRPLSFTVTLSEWFYNGLIHYEVLTINPEYFKLTKSIDRRIYEIAKKHCGAQAIWKINIDLLAQKVGIDHKQRFKVRDDIRKIIKSDSLPDYHVALDINATPDDVVFYTRDTGKLTTDLIQKKLLQWFQSLERHKIKA